ncbi:MAG: coproporphyrinogen III oxidase, partial [Bacteroidota bacterium]|nr:coproporphyrinogen III oxidase [Bacteroidota bacterium]
DFVFEVGNAFLPAYLPLVHENVAKTFTPQEREWQLHRRGRYVEFNLVWDRGTRFGLVSNGRTESILMSLPPEVKWTYDYDAGPKERETLGWLKKGIDWAGTPSQS